MEIEQIKNHLRRALVGEKLQYIVRSCELIDLDLENCFGEKTAADMSVKWLRMHSICFARSELLWKADA